MKTSEAGGYRVGDQLEIRIERIVPNGFGMGFAERLTVFTPLTSAGDVVRVQIGQLKKRIAFAEVVEVLERSPARVDPPCKYFGTCGGCDLQQMTYAEQLAAKTGIVRDCLKRIGQIDWTDEIQIIGSPQEFAYRSRARWHLDPQSRKLGYLKRNSHEVVDIDECLVLVPELNAELARIRQDTPWEVFWDETSRIDAAAGSGSVSIWSPEFDQPAKEIENLAAGERFVYSAEAFFQGNTFLLDKLIDSALGGAGGEKALDLYSGVGLFSLPMARQFHSVTAVEENEKAVEFAIRSAENSSVKNIQFVSMPVRAFLREMPPGEVDFLLLDPPRSGTEVETISRIRSIRPREISYVSCEPSILARDLKALTAGYSIRSIVALDLFPQTHHVETIVRLVRE